MDAIDKLNISEKSRQIYKNALTRHIPKGIDYKDFDRVVSTLKATPEATRITVVKALFHVTQDERYAKYHQDLSDRYKSSLMEKPSPDDIDWNELARERKKALAQKPKSQEAHALYVWVLLMKHHPRRFSDYYLLNLVPSDTINYYDRVNGKITFNVFKTAKSLTAGEKVVFLDDEVRRELDRYIEAFFITDRLFPVKRERIRYLMKKHSIPLCNHNRKFQETRDIQNGKSHYEVAKRFNHSIGTHMIHYVKLPHQQ